MIKLKKAYSVQYFYINENHIVCAFVQPPDKTTNKRTIIVLTSTGVTYEIHDSKDQRKLLGIDLED